MKTLKTLAIICLGALLCGACTSGSNEQEQASGLVLSFSPSTIYDNGEDYAEPTLKLNGAVVTDYTLYNALTDEVVVLENGRFTSTTKGTFTFWASHGTLTSNTAKVTVITTPPAAPEAPVDATPSQTNFKRRVLLTQFTGTGCGWCPEMMNALYLVNQKRGDDIVIAAAHLWNTDDPMYLADAPSLDNSQSVFSYPGLTVDLIDSDGGTSRVETYIINMINKALNRVDVKGGIAANTLYYADKGFITATVLVKAKETTEFRVGAWLLEDDIYAKQANNGITPVEGVDFNTHHNVIRIADSRKTNMDFSGHDLGKIEAGATATKNFYFELKDGWNPEKLRVVFFISTKEGDEWYVNNVVSASSNGTLDFRYE